MPLHHGDIEHLASPSPSPSAQLRIPRAACRCLTHPRCPLFRHPSLLQLYDAAPCLVLHEVVEVVGILSHVPQLVSLEYGQGGEDPFLSQELASLGLREGGGAAAAAGTEAAAAGAGSGGASAARAVGDAEDFTLQALRAAHPPTSKVRCVPGRWGGALWWCVVGGRLQGAKAPLCGLTRHCFAIARTYMCSCGWPATSPYAHKAVAHAQVMRLHGIIVRRAPNLVPQRAAQAAPAAPAAPAATGDAPAASTSAAPTTATVLATAPTGSVATLRSRALSLLRLALGGDALAAEYVLLQLLARVTHRGGDPGSLAHMVLNLSRCEAGPHTSSPRLSSGRQRV